MTAIDPASVLAEDLAGDVHPMLHQLRESAPVSWVPAIERWLVTSRDLVLEAMRDAERFTVDDERFTTAQVVGPSMLSLDGPEHARHRDPFAHPFRRSASVSNYAELTRSLADELVGQLARNRIVDLRAQVAAPLAAGTIAHALGLVGTTTDELLDWYRSIVADVEAATAGETPNGSGLDGFRALSNAVEATRRVPGTLMHAIDQAGELSPAELQSNAAVVLFGAIETSEGMTANALFHVLSDPSVTERLAAQPELIDNAVEESLRLEPAATLVDRFTTEPVTLGGVELPERAAVALSLAGANRDPAHFENPDRFELDRANAAHHLAFVHGPHACIGMHLARLETRAALESLLRRAPDVRLADGSPSPTGLVFRKPAMVSARL